MITGVKIVKSMYPNAVARFVKCTQNPSYYGVYDRPWTADNRMDGAILLGYGWTKRDAWQCAKNRVLQKIVDKFGA